MKHYTSFSLLTSLSLLLACSSGDNPTASTSGSSSGGTSSACGLAVEGCPVIACECEDLGRTSGSVMSDGKGACLDSNTWCGIACMGVATRARCLTEAEWDGGVGVPKWRQPGETCNPKSATTGGLCDVRSLPTSYECGDGRKPERRDEVLRCPEDTKACYTAETLKDFLCK